MTRFLSTNVLLVTLLLLVLVFESTTACGRRRRNHRHHYGKRSIENSDSEDITDETIEDSDEGPESSHDIHKALYDPYPRMTAEEHARQIKKQKRSQQIKESLPDLPDTSCGKILCTESPNYPTAAIAEVVAEAHRILKSGNSTAASLNRALNLKSFDSRRKIHNKESFFAGSCGGRQAIYPLVGFNSWYKEYFYVVNIPELRQGVCVQECPSNERQYQGYTEEALVVLPIGQRQFKVQDLKIRNIAVPYDCLK